MKRHVKSFLLGVAILVASLIATVILFAVSFALILLPLYLYNVVGPLVGVGVVILYAAVVSYFIGREALE